MAGRHVGIDIGVRVDNSVFDSVDRRIDKVKANAEQLNRVLSRTKISLIVHQVKLKHRLTG